MGSSISMTNLSSWVIFVPCLVQAIPIKLLTVNSHPMIIGRTKSLHTTDSCENIVFPIWNFTVITPCVTMSLPDAFLNFGTSDAFSDNFSLPNRSTDMQLFCTCIKQGIYLFVLNITGNVIPVSLPKIILKT